MRILGVIAIIGSFYLVKYREQIGDSFGEADWMAKVGGVYNMVLIVAAIFLIWGVAALVGTLKIFYAPILFFVPGGKELMQ
jgi:uncharacterized membrane protein